MRKLIVSEFVTLDGVMQAPGGKDEDRDGGFEYGGWTWPYWHDDIGKGFMSLMKDVDALLLGHRTYVTHAEAFEPMPAGEGCRPSGGRVLLAGARPLGWPKFQLKLSFAMRQLVLCAVTQKVTFVTDMVTMARPDGIARLLFGAVRRDVLALLYGRPDESFYLREIQRAVGAGIGPVQRELQLLTDAGLIEREQRGYHVYFSANRDAPIFSELQAILRKTAGAAEVLRASLGSLLVVGKIDAAFVYGSVAEGKQTSRSDVDVFLLGDATLGEVVPAIRAAGARLGRDVNPVIYSRKELRAKLKAGSAFLRRVLTGPKLMIVGDRHAVERLAR